MATGLNLGDVTFGLGADTKGLDKSVALLHKFGQQIDKTARRQDDASQKQVAALARQEAAIRGALQQVMNLNQQLRASGAPTDLIRRNTTAFRQFTKGMTQTNLTLKDQLRLQGRLQGSLGKTRRSLAGLKSGRAARGFGRMTEVMRDLESASVLAVGPLSGIGARIRALGAIANRSTLFIVGLIAGVTGLVVVFTKLFAATIQARVQMDKIMGAMQQATGSAFFAKKEFEFVTEVADRMGQKVSDTAEAFSQFAAAARDTKVEGQGVRTVFEGVLSAVTALRLPTETQTGLFRALTQMMSKGVIQSEELRGQFGERLAGGFEIVRKKVGATRAEFAKMLKQGKLISEKFLIPIGEAMQETFGEQAKKSAQTFTAAVNRMSNAQFAFNLVLEDAIDSSQVAIGVINSLTSSIQFLTGNMDNAGAAVTAFGVAIAVVFAPQLVALVMAIGRGIGFLAGAVWTLNFALLALPGIGIISWLLRLAAGVAAGTAVFFGFTNAVDEATKKTKKLMEETEELLKVEQLRNTLQEEQTARVLENTVKRIQAIEAEAQALRDFMTVDPQRIAEGFGATFAQQLAGKELAKVDAVIAKLRENVVRLQVLLAMGIPELGGDADEISKAMEKAAEKVDDFALALEQANLQIENIGKDVALDPGFIDAMFEARDIIKELTDEELVQLQLKLESVGFSSANAAEGLTQLVFASEQAEEKFKDLLKAFEKSPGIMKDINEEFDRMNQQIEAFGQSVDAVDKLNEAFERKDAIEAYKEELEKLTDAARAMVPTLDEFIAKLDEFDKAEEKFERLKDITAELADVVGSSFRAIGSSIVDGIKKGELTMKSFVKTLEDVAARILDAVIEMLIIQPILAAIQGGIGSIAGGIVAGGGGAGSTSLFGGLLFSKKGNVFDNGRLKKFAKGTVLNRSTILPLANGDTGIAGEAGPEGVLPLARTKTGDLGVKVAGSNNGGGGMAGPNFTVNLNFPPGTDIQSFGESTGQIGNTIAGFLQIATASNG